MIKIVYFTLMSLMVMPDTSEQAAQRADAIVVAEVTAFETKTTPLPGQAGDHIPLKRDQVVHLYTLNVLEVSKGKVEMAPKPLTARFEWVRIYAVDPNVSISQAIPGSGLEGNAREGKWQFFLGPAHPETGVREVIRVDRVPAPEA